jgi:hypothetical protein
VQFLARADTRLNCPLCDGTLPSRRFSDYRPNYGMIDALRHVEALTESVPEPSAPPAPEQANTDVPGEPPAPAPAQAAQPVWVREPLNDLDHVNMLHGLPGLRAGSPALSWLLPHVWGRAHMGLMIDARETLGPPSSWTPWGVTPDGDSVYRGALRMRWLAAAPPRMPLMHAAALPRMPRWPAAAPPRMPLRYAECRLRGRAGRAGGHPVHRIAAAYRPCRLPRDTAQAAEARALFCDRRPAGPRTAGGWHRGSGALGGAPQACTWRCRVPPAACMPRRACRGAGREVAAQQRRGAPEATLHASCARSRRATPVVTPL